MVNWNNPQPCGECGKMVHKEERHTFEDCKDWKKTIRNLRKSCNTHHENDDTKLKPFDNSNDIGDADHENDGVKKNE